MGTLLQDNSRFSLHAVGQCPIQLHPQPTDQDSGKQDRHFVIRTEPVRCEVPLSSLTPL